MSNAQKTQSNPPLAPKGGPQRGGPMMGGGIRIGGAKAKDFKGSILKLLRYLKPHLLQIAIAVFFTAIATVLSIVAPSFVKELTNAIAVSATRTLPNGMVIPGTQIDMSEVAKYATILAIFYGCNLMLSYVQSFIMAGVNQKVSKSLRTSISTKINKLPLKYYDKNSIGDTLSRVTNDIDTIGQTLNQSFNTLISSVIMLIGVLIAMFINCWQLALTTIVTVPISIVVIGIIIKLSQKYFKSQQKNLGTLNGHIEEIYTGQSIVKAFNGENKATEKFDETNNKLRKGARKAQFISGLMMPLMSFVSNLGYIAICAVGGALYVNDVISIGIISSFFIYIRLFQNPMAQIAQAANSLQSTAAAAERVFEYLEEPEQLNEDEKTSRLDNIKGKVEFRNVRFGYDENKVIIKNFSATVMPGQKVAIVGPTGAGKTTMINLLMRFYELNDGQILIDDIPISDMKREDVRACFGMVLQDTWLFEGTIRDNIVYSKQGVTDEQIVEACQAANIDHYINTLPKGYDMVLGDNANISGGQRQLLTIARAMIQNSPMLILDEATSNVDTRTEQLIQDAMDKIVKGRTSFVIAHRLSTIKNADLILVMKDGDIIESGTHNTLINSKGFYYNLYNSQFEIENN